MRESEDRIGNSGLDKLSILTSESKQRIWVGPLRIRGTPEKLGRAHKGRYRYVEHADCFGDRCNGQAGRNSRAPAVEEGPPRARPDPQA